MPLVFSKARPYKGIPSGKFRGEVMFRHVGRTHNDLAGRCAAISVVLEGTFSVESSACASIDIGLVIGVCEPRTSIIIRLNRWLF